MKAKMKFGTNNSCIIESSLDVEALKELLIDKGIITQEDFDTEKELLEEQYEQNNINIICTK